MYLQISRPPKKFVKISSLLNLLYTMTIQLTFENGSHQCLYTHIYIYMYLQISRPLKKYVETSSLLNILYTMTIQLTFENLCLHIYICIYIYICEYIHIYTYKYIYMLTPASSKPHLHLQQHKRLSHQQQRKFFPLSPTHHPLPPQVNFSKVNSFASYTAKLVATS